MNGMRASESGTPAPAGLASVDALRRRALLVSGNTISTPQIISLISPHASQTTTIAIQLAIFAVEPAGRTLEEITGEPDIIVAAEDALRAAGQPASAA
jgi:hypothetical protein